MSASKQAKPKMGRPPLPRGMQRTEQLNVRATRAERRMLEAEAKRRGITVSDLLMEPWRGQKAGKDGD